MSRGLASRDSHATHRSRAVDTGCLRMGAPESRRLDLRPGSGGLLVARSLSAPVRAVGILWFPPPPAPRRGGVRSGAWLARGGLSDCYRGHGGHCYYFFSHLFHGDVGPGVRGCRL